MFARVTTVAFSGIEARKVDVQVQLGSGLPAFNIVGLPDKTVAESRERVRSALNTIGLGLPPKRITVNLAPADLPKEGSHFDLPIALGLMISAEAISPNLLEPYCIIGELSLDGAVRHVDGALPAAIGANAMNKGLICPENCGKEAAWASPDMEILAVDHILPLINHFRGSQLLSRPEPELSPVESGGPDLIEVKGQESAKRALEIAAAGGHNLLLVGPPGSGKSMLASRLPSVLPALEPDELLDVSMVQSMAGELKSGGLDPRRPFRAPHHSATMAALVGGGTKPKPGEISLAHHGVLFLDELPEFSPQVLDALRQPLETGEVAIVRANHRVVYPARIQLVAAMNPCKCGNALEPGYQCRLGRNCAERYVSRISGPFLDRIDLHIEVPAVKLSDLLNHSSGEPSDTVRARVSRARSRQRNRFSELGLSMTTTNATCPVQRLEELSVLSKEGRSLLMRAAKVTDMSARGYHRTIRVALTLADLDGEAEISEAHMAESLSLRSKKVGPA